jgi:hypothetical protein
VNTLKSTVDQLKAGPIQDERDTISTAPRFSARLQQAPRTLRSPPHAARTEAVDDQKPSGSTDQAEEWP